MPFLLYSLTSYKCDGTLFTVNIILTYNALLIKCELWYNLSFTTFLQDQTGGLEPSGVPASDCIYLASSRGYHFADDVCDTTRAPLCEAPLEALTETV